MQIPTDEITWQVLANCKITLPLVGLLKLVPRFMKAVATIITKKESEQVVVNFTNPIQGTTIMDEHSHSVKVIIRGQEVSNSIIDGGSGVNVISKMTCAHRGITDWEVSPFWL